MKTTTQKEEEFTSFEDAVVLVAGKATPLSMGIVNAFLSKQATVIVPFVSLHEIEKLKAYKNNGDYSNLVTMLTDLTDFDKATTICDAIVEKYGKMDISIGLRNEQKCHKLITEVSGDEWEAMIGSVITPFFVHARVVLNIMKQLKAGLFVSVGNIVFPKNERFSALSKIEITTIRQMSKIFAEEAHKDNVQFHHLYVSDFGDNKLSEGKVTGNSNGEKTAERIIELYYKESFNPESVFEILSFEETPFTSGATEIN